MPHLHTPHASAQADGWAEHYATASGFRWWPCEELVRAVGDRRFGTVLEVGCGNGANLWFLAEHSDWVVGVDASARALREAKRYMGERDCAGVVTLVQGRADALEAGDATVDAVVDVMVSQHARWSEHAALYAEYRRVLRRGGRLFLYHLGQGTSDEGGAWVEDYTRDRLDLFPTAGEVCLPPAGPLSQAVRGAGFAVVEQRAVARHYAKGQVATYHVIEGEAA